MIYITCDPVNYSIDLINDYPRCIDWVTVDVSTLISGGDVAEVVDAILYQTDALMIGVMLITFGLGLIVGRLR